MLEKRVEIKKNRGTFEIYFKNLDGSRRKVTIGGDFKKAKQMANQIDTWLARGLEPEKELAKLQTVKTPLPKESSSGEHTASSGGKPPESIDKELLTRLKDFANATGRNVYDIINEAVASYLDTVTVTSIDVVEKELESFRAGTIVHGDAAIDLFGRLFLNDIGSGAFISYMGKWISTVITESTGNRKNAEAESIRTAIESGDSDALRTMIVGGEITSIEYERENDVHIITARQKTNSYKITFEDVIIYYRMPIVDPVTNNAPRTYMYLLGTPFNSPMNLFAFYHTDV